MLWLIRIGLGVWGGPQASTAMSWDELLLSPDVAPDKARQALEAAVNEGVNTAIGSIGRAAPFLAEAGGKVRAGFSGRGRVTLPYKLELTAGPAESDCPSLAVAIGAARMGCHAAIHELSRRLNQPVSVISSTTQKKPIPLLVASNG
jgi:hypothetical protein